MSASLSSPAKLCPHFGSCGGCATQDVPYEEQLRRKAERVRAALGAAGCDAELKVHPAPQLWFYRNKMEFGFGDVYPALPPGQPTLRLGLKPKGRWYEVLDLSECRLLSPEAGALLAAVRAWAEENAVPPYNSHKHTGLLRNLVVREAKNGGERMIVLVTNPGEAPRESFLAAVRGAYPATTILRGINGKVSDTAVSERLELWEGAGVITETLRFGKKELKFRISPQSFFQTNTSGAEVLYGILRGWAARAAAGTLLDLYCGGGGIGISAAEHCRKLVGVELNASAVADASGNARLNGIAHAQFLAGAVESMLPELALEKCDAAIVDPPRAGLHPRALKAVLELAPPSLFYVSCNPEALARDLGLLKEKYRVEKAEMVDLFPHTEHVESAVRLARY